MANDNEKGVAMIITADIWNIFWIGVGIGVAIGAGLVIGILTFIMWKINRRK